MPKSSISLKKTEERVYETTAIIKDEIKKVNSLKNAVDRFMNIKIDENDSKNYNIVFSGIHEICGNIIDLDNKISKDEIMNFIKPAYLIQGLSPLVKRLREWPKGYIGDYETIEYLLYGNNKAKDKTIEFFCEAFALKSGPALQHKYKIIEQAQLVLKTIMRQNVNNKIKILSIGCGSSPDLQLIQDYIKDYDVYFDLIDNDEQALEYSKIKLKKILNKTNFIHGNIIKLMHELSKNKYDLIVSSGLFDYMPDKIFCFLLRTLYSRCLKDNGILFLTNIADDNPYKMMFKYFIHWELIERNEKELIKLLNQASINSGNINIRRDPTGITFLVEIKKKLF